MLIDWCVGQLTEALDRLNVSENTLIIVTSDNGPRQGMNGHKSAGNLRGLKGSIYEGGHRIPFIARWPAKIKPGSTTGALTTFTDMMATFAAIVGAKLPPDAGEDSVSILPALLGEERAEPIRDYTLSQTMSLAMGIRQGPWKLLDHRGSGGNNYDSPLLRPWRLENTAPGAAGQLYNLDVDPGETTNLYLKRPEIVAELKRLLATSRESGRSAASQE